jgi:hypothetical protein
MLRNVTSGHATNKFVFHPFPDTWLFNVNFFCIRISNYKIFFLCYRFITSKRKDFKKTYTYNVHRKNELKKKNNLLGNKLNEKNLFNVLL